LKAGFPAYIVQSIEDGPRDRSLFGKVLVLRVKGFGRFYREPGPFSQDIREGSLAGMPLAQVRMLSTKGSDD
jgi:hypothetical protein